MHVQYAIIDQTGTVYEIGAAREEHVPARVPEGHGWLRHDGSVSQGSLPLTPESIDPASVYYIVDGELKCAPITKTRAAAPDPIQQAIDYLNSTDWMVIRLLENGTDIPLDVQERRRLAREIAGSKPRHE